MDKPRIQYSWLQFRTKRISGVIHFLFLVVVDLCRQQSSWRYLKKKKKNKKQKLLFAQSNIQMTENNRILILLHKKEVKGTVSR